MLISSEQIRSKLSPILQRLMDDVLAKSDGRPLVFGDAQEHQNIIGLPFPPGCIACLIPTSKSFIICIKQLDSISDEEEKQIAHELGHLWLTFHDFPREKRSNLSDKQQRYDICFGPLLEIMEHAIFYPWLKTNYGIDLYKIGNQRLYEFLHGELPNRKIESEGDQIPLIMNYLKFKIESDDSYWQERLSKAYSKVKFVNLKEIVERLLPIIQQVASKSPDSQCFITKFREALEIMNIKPEIWPDFAQVIS